MSPRLRGVAGGGRLGKNRVTSTHSVQPDRCVSLREEWNEPEIEGYVPSEGYLYGRIKEN